MKARGEDHYRAVLTEQQVREMRADFARRHQLRREAMSLNNEGLAEKYGVSAATVQAIYTGRSWSHVK